MSGTGMPSGLGPYRWLAKLESVESHPAIVLVVEQPGYSLVPQSQVADEYAKAAAIGSAPGEEVPEGYLEETSLPHMTRVATEAISREPAE